MDTAEKGPFNQSQHPWYRPRTLALPLPLIAYRNGRLTIDASEMASNCAVRKCFAALFRYDFGFIVISSCLNYINKSLLT
jgi:hypothetical protein